MSAAPDVTTRLPADSPFTATTVFASSGRTSTGWGTKRSAPALIQTTG